MSSLGSNIRFLRERHNITPLAMSKRLNISLQDYNAWESGLSLPSINNVMDICAVYELKNPTDLFSDNFQQLYSANLVKVAKENGRRAAEEQGEKAQTNTKQKRELKDGSYYGNGTLFNVSICLAIGILISLFLPAFLASGKSVIGYLAFRANVFSFLLILVIAISACVITFFGFRANYKILAGNGFMDSDLAIKTKVFYLSTGLIVGLVALLNYFTIHSYEFGMTVFTGFCLVYMLFGILSALSVKHAPQDMETYIHAIKFTKYKLKSNKARKTLKTLSILGLIISVVCTGLAVVQFVMNKVLLVDQLGINSGIVATITTAFYDILTYIGESNFSKVIITVVMLGIIGLNISNIIVANRMKVTDYNGYLDDDKTSTLRLHIAINFAINIVLYVLAYALLLVNLCDSVESTKVIYEYYLIPVLTGVSLFVAIKLLVYPCTYNAFRGAETDEVAGYSEVDLDEEKKQRKLDRKTARAAAKKEKEQKSLEVKNISYDNVVEPPKVAQVPNYNGAQAPRPIVQPATTTYNTTTNPQGTSASQPTNVTTPNTTSGVAPSNVNRPAPSSAPTGSSVYGGQNIRPTVAPPQAAPQAPRPSAPVQPQAAPQAPSPAPTTSAPIIDMPEVVSMDDEVDALNVQPSAPTGTTNNGTTTNGTSNEGGNR